MTAVVGAAALAFGVLLLWPGGRLGPARLRASDLGVPEPHPSALLRRLRGPLSVLAVLAGWLVLGGWFGGVVGLVGGFLGWRVLGRVEGPGVAQRRAALERDLPVGVSLLGAALAAGASPVSAVLAVADALPGPLAAELRVTHHRLQLGLDPVSVWGAVGGPLRPLGRTMVRAHESGASVRSAVEALAEELRQGARLRVETLARTVEVRASVPLGLCFLPAFVLLGVVPMAVGIFSTLRLFG